MLDHPRTIPMSGDPCPPADESDAILLWIRQQHVRNGRIERHGEHHDPFWRCVEDKQAQRCRLAELITASDDASERIAQLAWLFRLAWMA